MSEIASVVERTRKAFATVSRLEDAIARQPLERSLHLNLAAMRKVAAQAQEQLMHLSEMQQIEVCSYRLLPAATDSYGLAHVSRSFLEYQNLFTQVHDAICNGARQYAVWGPEAEQESALEFAYTYSGSLGVVLLAPSERDFFKGRLDLSIDALFEIMEIKQRGDVREVKEKYGKPVVKRMHDWSEANVKGGFATDVRWNRSDGRKLGQVVERETMAHILQLMAEASDEKRRDIDIEGILVGGDVMSGSFHFVEPNKDGYRGSFAPDYSAVTTLTLGQRYYAKITEIVTEKYATEQIVKRYELRSIIPLDEVASGS